MFVCVPYGGRASDRHIVQDSGFLDKISPTDQVMADLGFPFQSDLVMRQASLIIPPPAQETEQMTKENVLKQNQLQIFTSMSSEPMDGSSGFIF